MLTPEYLAGISAPLQEIYAELQAEIEADIARRIKKAGGKHITDTAAWQIEKLQELGASRAYIAERISALGHHDKTTAEMNALFEAAGIKTSATDEATRKAMLAAGRSAPTIPLTATPAMRQVLHANMNRTRGTLQRLTGTMATDAGGKLNKYLDQAQLMVQSGAFTVQQATDKAVTNFAAEGIHAFDYASGIRTSVEAAVRRAVVTGVNQATAQVSEANATALGTDLVEVTSHADARPEHAVWQGQVYSLSGRHPKYRSLAEATGYGTGAGLCGWNCRHSFYAFVEGISEALPKPKYDDTTYQAEQKQRYNERMIRMWKRRANTLEAGGVDATRAKQKIAFWQARQREHVKRYDLARMYNREKVYGMPSIPRVPRPTGPTPEELAKKAAADKAEAKRIAERERVRKWRAEKKAAAERGAAEAAEAARKAAEEAAKKAAEDAERLKAEAMAREKAEAKKKAERERVRRYRAEKRAAEEAARKAAEDAARVAAEEATMKKTAEELAREKAEAKKIAERERVRKWRAEKKAADSTKKAAPAAPARAEAAAAKKAAEDAAKKAAEDAAKAAAAKKAAEDAAKAAAAAKKVVNTEPIKAFSPRVGEPGTYRVYRSTGKSIPPDGITAFHGRQEAAGLASTVKAYDISIKKPLVVEARTLAEAREKAFVKLTGESPSRFMGDKGAAVAKGLRTDGYDSIIYKLADDHFELDPIDFSMAKAPTKTAKEIAAEAAEAAKKLAEEKVRKAAEAAAAKKAAAEAAERAKKRAAERAAKGLPDRTKDGAIPPTLENFEKHRDSLLASELRGADPGEMEAAVDFVSAAMDKAAIRSRIDQKTMRWGLLQDDMLKTQIHLDYDRKQGKNVRVTSGGMNNPDARRRASGELFGTDIDKTDRRKFEYYGYVWDDDFVADFEWDGPEQYGPSTLQFKEHVRQVTTFTCGDSLGSSYVPSYLDEVTMSWAGGYNTKRLAEAAAQGVEPTVHNVYRQAGSTYIEAQYHGGFTLKDVEAFVIGPDDFKREGIDKVLCKELNKRGIKVGLVEATSGAKKGFRWLTEGVDF